MLELAEIENEHVGHCIICGTNDIRYNERATYLLGLPQPFRVFQCQNCDLSWLNPRPTQVAYEKIYTSEYFKDYSNTVALRKKKFIGRITRIKSSDSGKGLSLLDVGCATGEFVKLCRERGIDAKGVEYSEDAVRVAKDRIGNYFYHGDLRTVKELGLKFDIVHLSHVFEHFLLPDSMLNEITMLLNVDGLLVLEVPYQFDNILEFFLKLTGRNRQKRFGLLSIHHPFFYTPKSLKKILRKNGFDILSLKTYLPTNEVGSEIPCGIFFKKALLKAGDLFLKKGDLIEVFCKL